MRATYQEFGNVSRWLNGCVNEALRDLTWQSHAGSTWFKANHCMRTNTRPTGDDYDDEDGEQ
jgi:hypothetical protein